MHSEIFRVVSTVVVSLYFVLDLGNSDYFWTLCEENALGKTIFLLLSKYICKKPTDFKFLQINHRM